MLTCASGTPMGDIRPKKLATESQSFILSQPIPQLGQEFSIFLIWMRSLSPCHAQGFADRIFVPYGLTQKNNSGTKNAAVSETMFP